MSGDSRYSKRAVGSSTVYGDRHGNSVCMYKLECPFGRWRAINKGLLVRVLSYFYSPSTTLSFLPSENENCYARPLQLLTKCRFPYVQYSRIKGRKEFTHVFLVLCLFRMQRTTTTNAKMIGQNHELAKLSYATEKQKRAAFLSVLSFPISCLSLDPAAAPINLNLHLWQQRRKRWFCCRQSPSILFHPGTCSTWNGSQAP